MNSEQRKILVVYIVSSLVLGTTAFYYVYGSMLVFVLLFDNIYAFLFKLYLIVFILLSPFFFYLYRRDSNKNKVKEKLRSKRDLKIMLLILSLLIAFSVLIISEEGRAFFWRIFT